jgi:glycyl-tRNA synthetase alpha chain
MFTFQEVVSNLNIFWSQRGCALIPTYPADVGAATFHPSTIFNCCGNRLPSVGLAYVQPCVRPADNRGGVSKNRLYQHHQYQVLIKPVPSEIQDWYLASLGAIGIDPRENDIKFIEDNWENPSIGAYGIGWEVQLNGMEVTQYTYMQQVGGVECPVTPVELAYGLERLVMIIQEKDSVYDIIWNESGVTYRDLFWENERQNAAALVKGGAGGRSLVDLQAVLQEARQFLDQRLPLVAYSACLRASHVLNMLDAKGTLGYNDRASYILTIKDVVRGACELWCED